MLPKSPQLIRKDWAGSCWEWWRWPPGHTHPALWPRSSSRPSLNRSLLFWLVSTLADSGRLIPSAANGADNLSQAVAADAAVSCCSSSCWRWCHQKEDEDGHIDVGTRSTPGSESSSIFRPASCHVSCPPPPLWSSISSLYRHCLSPSSHSRPLGSRLISSSAQISLQNKDVRSLMSLSTFPISTLALQIPPGCV